MKNHILKILEIHCLIYKKDFNNYLEFFENNFSKDSSDFFISEFIRIYENYNIYEDIFYKIKKTSIEKFDNVKKRENFFSSLNEHIEKDFWIDFFCISILNGLIKETYYESKKKEYNSVNTIELVNYVCEDFLKFINFLYVSNFIDIDSSYFNNDSIKKFVLRLLYNLKDKNIITIKKITVFNEDKKEIKYSNFITIDNFKKPKNLFMFFNIGNEPPVIKKRKNIILIGFNHYMTNINLITKKPFKGESIVYDEFIRNMEKKSKTKFFIDEYMIEVLNSKIKKIKNNSIEENLNNLKIEYNKKKTILDEMRHYEDVDIILKKLKNKISKTQKELSLNIDFWIFENFYSFIKNFKNGFYFIPYADFRGRTYTHSKVSPQSNWIFRFIFNFGKDKISRETENNLIIKKDLIDKMKIIGINKDYEILGWVFMSIGFLFKKNIRSDKIKAEEFIEEGIKNYTKLSKDIEKIYTELEISKAVECIYYFKIIEDHVKGIMIKRYVIKDTTASVYQHLGKVLIFKNEEALNITNLGKEDLWRDTYRPLMDKFDTEIENSIKPYFIRKNMKKLLFTTKYNIGPKKAFKDFKEDIDFIEDKETYKKIASTFQKIYLNLIKGIVENEILYKHSLKDLNKKLIKEEYFKLEDIKVNLTYHKFIKKEITIFENKKRITLVNYKSSKEVDIEKMKISNVPNIVHSIDALYARRVCKEFYDMELEICVNHDAFYVSYDKIGFLIKVAQKCIKIEENFEFLKGSNKRLDKTSIFILS